MLRDRMREVSELGWVAFIGAKEGLTRSSSLSLKCQSCRSFDRLISSAVQNEACAFLYICQIW